MFNNTKLPHNQKAGTSPSVKTVNQVIYSKERRVTQVAKTYVTIKFLLTDKIIVNIDKNTENVQSRSPSTLVLDDRCFRWRWVLFPKGLSLQGGKNFPNFPVSFLIMESRKFGNRNWFCQGKLDQYSLKNMFDPLEYIFITIYQFS